MTRRDPVAPEAREALLKLIQSAPQSERMDVVDHVAEQLGINTQKFAPSLTSIARRLGVTYDRLHYMVMRESILHRERQARNATRNASQIEGIFTRSNSLGFEIWIPEGWQVKNDTGTFGALPEESHDRIRGTRGYWSAGESGDILEEEETLEVEITCFELSKELSSSDIYEMSKPHEDCLSWASARKKAPMLGNMESVWFYGSWYEPYPVDQFSVYATSVTSGWVIDCWSSPNYTRKWRPVFRRMIESFAIH